MVSLNYKKPNEELKLGIDPKCFHLHIDGVIFIQHCPARIILVGQHF
jgi:hypothetical protein